LKPAGAMFISTYDGIQLGASLGKGGTAEVIRGDLGGHPLAVKRLGNSTPLEQKAFRREVTILAGVQHKNVVVCFGFCESPTLMTIFMECCEGGCVFDLVHNSSVELATTQKCSILGDVALAMEYLHGSEPKILHRDLKSLNLLLARQVCSKQDVPCIKLCDFGSACVMEVQKKKFRETCMTVKVGTCHWMAPEMPSGPYDEKVDVYSFAMVAFELFCHEIPFGDLDFEDIFLAVAEGARPDLRFADLETPPAIIDLTVQCWAQLPAERPSFQEVSRTLLQKFADRSERGTYAL